MDNIFGIITLVTISLMTRLSEAGKLQHTGLLDKMPPACTGKDFCLEPHHDYPHKTINWLLTKKYQIELGSARAESPTIRDGDDEFIENYCEKNITFGLIYEIVDKNDEVRLVVQSQKYKQQFRIEQCLHTGPLSLEGSTVFDSEELKIFDLRCEDKKMHYNFLVLTRDGKGLELARSKRGIPVCCFCKLY